MVRRLSVNCDEEEESEGRENARVLYHCTGRL